MDRRGININNCYMEIKGHFEIRNNDRSKRMGMTKEEHETQIIHSKVNIEISLIDFVDIGIQSSIYILEKVSLFY